MRLAQATCAGLIALTLSLLAVGCSGGNSPLTPAPQESGVPKQQVQPASSPAAPSLQANVNVPLKVTGIFPAARPAGSEVEIQGEGFDTEGSSNEVYFNGIAAAIISVEATRLRVIVPQIPLLWSAQKGDSEPIQVPVKVVTRKSSDQSQTFTVDDQVPIVSAWASSTYMGSPTLFGDALQLFQENGPPLGWNAGCYATKVSHEVPSHGVASCDTQIAVTDPDSDAPYVVADLGAVHEVARVVVLPLSDPQWLAFWRIDLAMGDDNGNGKIDEEEWQKGATYYGHNFVGDFADTVLPPGSLGRYVRMYAYDWVISWVNIHKARIFARNVNTALYNPSFSSSGSSGGGTVSSATLKDVHVDVRYQVPTERGSPGTYPYKLQGVNASTATVTIPLSGLNENTCQLHILAHAALSDGETAFTGTIVKPARGDWYGYATVDRCSAGSTLAFGKLLGGGGNSVYRTVDEGTVSITKDNANLYVSYDSSKLPRIGAISVSEGSAGSGVLIQGTFANDAQVFFNGTAGTIYKQTSTAILTKVPPTATSGYITITSGGQTITGPYFTVTRPPHPISPVDGWSVDYYRATRSFDNPWTFTATPLGLFQNEGFWVANGGACGSTTVVPTICPSAWISADLGAMYDLSQVRLLVNANPSGELSQWHIDASLDNVNWTEHVGSGSADHFQFGDTNFDPPIHTRYVRIVADRWGANNASWVSTFDVQYRGVLTSP